MNPSLGASSRVAGGNAEISLCEMLHMSRQLVGTPSQRRIIEINND